MRLVQCLPLAALATAIVIPDEQILADLVPEDYNGPIPDHNDLFTSKNNVVDDILESSKDVLDKAFSSISDTGAAAYKKIYDAAYDVEAWLQSSTINSDELESLERENPPQHPHHPPHHGKSPHHGHQHNLTIYQLISESKYTTVLAKLISEDEELVKILNGTAANYTVFAPTDRAFAKIPEHAPKPSKKQIREVLSYHVSPEFYPAGRVLASHTIPTLLKSSDLGPEPLPQRLALGINLRGLTVNWYSRVVAVNIFGSNGVIHGVDSIIVPPPSVLRIIEFLPAEFSTLTLGLQKTGLLKTLKKTEHAGSTFFAPSNFAFQKLGTKINGFLFSKYGQKYLKALLQYHVVLDQTLYSDAFYKSSSDETTSDATRGLFHVDLPTLLDDRFLSVDIARYGPFITIKINGFSRVAVQDGVAKDGVIQVLADVLIPPKRLSQDRVSYWNGEEMSVDELKERLEPYLEDDQNEL